MLRKQSALLAKEAMLHVFEAEEAKAPSEVGMVASVAPSPLQSHRENLPRPRTSPQQRGREASQPRRRAGGPVDKAKKAASAKARNPFIEYDVREKRIGQERKWLQEDSTYLKGKKEDLKFGTLMNNMDIANFSHQDLYDKRTFYGPYSIAMKKSKQRAQSAGRQRPQSAAPGPAGAEAVRQRFMKEDCRAAASIRNLAKDLQNSCSEETRKGFRDAEARSKGLPTEEQLVAAEKDRAAAAAEEIKLALRGGL